MVPPLAEELLEFDGCWGRTVSVVQGRFLKRIPIP